MIGYLGLGSNIGDRRAMLQAAVDAIDASDGVQVLAASSTYDTDPVGEILDQPSFLNAAVRIETTLEPEALLDAVKAIEGTLGREAAIRHAPRVIDIDLLLLGDLQLRTDRLALPHREVLARRFVLVPLLELDLGLATPAGKRLADALAVLPVDEGVRREGDPLRAGQASSRS